MEKKTVYIVATQYDNVGDLLINKCLIDQLAKYGKVYLDTKNVPRAFKDLLFDGTTNVFELKELTQYSFKGIQILPLLFLTPGFTHVFKSPGPFSSKGSFKSFLQLFLIGLMFKILKFKGVKSSLVGNDIHFQGVLDRFLVKFYSANTEMMLCRSVENKLALENLGIKNVDYIPDLCFSHNSEIMDMKRHEVGVSFRQLNDINLDKKIIKMVQGILNNSILDITIFYQVERDYEYNLKLFENFKDNPRVRFNEKCLEWNDLGYYNRFVFTLSNRLHVLLLGAVHNVIPIALLNLDSKTEKITKIFQSVNLGFLLMTDLSDEKLKHLLENVDKIRGEVIEIVHKQSDLLDNAISDLFKD